MTCNYRNSAGTDLDSLFYVENANPGALGFKTSDGTDLGNRFTSGATLGYSVGYQNSAGTDIGYLRGNVFVPTLSNVKLTNTYATKTTRSMDSGEYTSEGYVGTSWYYPCYERSGYITISGSTNYSGSQNLYVTFWYVNTHPDDFEFVAAGVAGNAQYVAYLVPDGFHEPNSTAANKYCISPNGGTKSWGRVVSNSFAASTFSCNIAYNTHHYAWHNSQVRYAGLTGYRVSVSVGTSAGTSSETVLTLDLT
jgi:hypothetical protein